MDFSKAAFLAADGVRRALLCDRLGTVLTERMRRGGEFHETVVRTVSDLRALGHDLWSFDEDEQEEVWCSNYENPTGPGIIVTFRPERVIVEWSRA
jgi:hypothetical protein